MATVADDTQSLPSANERSDPQIRATGSVNRFRRVVMGAIVAAAIPYLWVLWDLWSGKVDLLRINESRTVPGSVEFDVQARALLHGHLSLPYGSIGIEAFIHQGRTYTYFGLLPSIIRMPVLLFTHSFDGRLSAPSLLLAWALTALFSPLLLWRIRVAIRGDAALWWAEAFSYGVLVFSILAGSVLVSLATTPNAYVEDEAWGIALACGSLFTLLGVIERPSWGRVTACGALVLLTNLNRGTTGYACVLGTFLVAAWFALGRAGPDRKRWAIPVLLAGLVALAVGCVIDYAKFDVLFGFPASEQTLYRVYGFSHINGGKHFSLHFLPATLQAYVLPGNLRFTQLFPYITFPELPTRLVAHTRLFNRGETSSVTASMPLLFGLGLWGALTTLKPKRPMMVRSFRLLLVTAAASAGAIVLYGTIYERFLGDFMPLLALASAIGMVDIWRRLNGRRQRPRVLVACGLGAVALFGFVANMGIAITPQDDWTQTQADHYIQAQQDLSNITGHPLSHDVIRAANPSAQAPIGQLFIKGQCKELYVSDGEGSAFPYPGLVWRPVERAPHTPICHALIGSATNASPTTHVIAPSPDETLSGSHVAVRATASGAGSISAVSFALVGTAKSVLLRPATLTRTGWTYVLDTRTEPNGHYTLRSVAYSTAGYIGVSSPITITIHNPIGGGT
jgi:hypothetical protein